MIGGIARNVTMALAIAAVATPAWAEPAQNVTVQAEPGKKGRDPNEVVCEKVEVIGSRLISKRECATRAQWAERRLRERLDVDKAQKTGMVGN